MVGGEGDGGIGVVRMVCGTDSRGLVERTRGGEWAKGGL